jgi:hypothetical protein
VDRSKYSAIPLPLPSYSCFLKGVWVLHGVRKERREVRDLPNLVKSRRMLWWFLLLVNS